jgi:hypothetical protein
MQEGRSRWLKWSVILALVILLLGSTLRRLWDHRVTVPAETPVVQPQTGSP